MPDSKAGLVALLVVAALAAPANAAPTNCQSRASELGDYLLKLASTQGPDLHDELVRLAAGKPLGEWMSVLTLTAEKVLLDGSEIGSSRNGPSPEMLKRLGEVLTVRNHNYRIVHKTEPPPIAAMAVSPRATWAALVSVVGILRQRGVRELAFLFAGPEPVPAPGRSAAAQDIERIKALSDPTEKAQAITRLTSSLVATCPQLAQRYARLASVAAAKKTAAMVKATTEGLSECNCAADLASIKALLYAILHIRPLVAHRRQLGNRARLGLLGSTLWAEAHKALLTTAAAVPLELVVKRR